MNSLCIVFNPSCPWTTGHYILKAAKKLGYITYFSNPWDIKPDVDLYLHVDSGHEDIINTPKTRTIFYAIDSYQMGLGMHEKGFNTRLAWWNYVQENVLCFFDAFYQGRDWFQKQGKKSYLIEMGIDEEIYYKSEKEKKYDICFVGGRKTNGTREQILTIVSKHYKLFSPETHNNGIREAASFSKCFLDIPPMEEDMLGQRFFEGYACQTPMVSMSRDVIIPYTDGIFLYNKTCLEHSLVKAIDQAMAYIKPINRDIDKMKWTYKVKFMIDTYSTLVST